MYNIPVENVRNFVLGGHSGSGKTALTDALAYKLGLNDRLGSPANGTSISDFTEEEKAPILAAIEKLKEANKGTDLEAIKAASEEVQKAFYPIAEKMYQQANPQGGAQGAPADDGVVDADYETVD